MQSSMTVSNTQRLFCGMFLTLHTVGAPDLGSPERGLPNLFRFPRFLPICSDLHSLFSGIPRFVPISSDLFRFVFRTNQNKLLSARPLLQIPDTVHPESITELSPKRAGPVIFKKMLLELIAFRLVLVICPARRAKPENDWKRSLIPVGAYPAIKSVNIQTFRCANWQVF